MGAFSYHRFIFLLACIDRWKAHTRLVSACTVKTAIEIQCACALTSKNCTLSGFFVSRRLFSLPAPQTVTIYRMLLKTTKPLNIVKFILSITNLPFVTAPSPLVRTIFF